MANEIYRAGLEVVASYPRTATSRLPRKSTKSYCLSDGMFIGAGTKGFVTENQDDRGVSESIISITSNGKTLLPATGFASPKLDRSEGYWLVSIDHETQALSFNYAGTYNLYFAVPGVGVLRSSKLVGPFLIDFSFYALAIVPYDAIDCNEVDLIRDLAYKISNLSSITHEATLHRNDRWQDAYFWDDAQNMGVPD